MINSPIFVPCSPIFSLARASSQRSKGVEDFAWSKTTNGRSPIFPYSRLVCLSVLGAGGGEAAVGGGEGPFVEDEGSAGGGDSRNNPSNFFRAAGGKSSFFSSASSSARSFASNLPGSKRSPLAP